MRWMPLEILVSSCVIFGGANQGGTDVDVFRIHTRFLKNLYTKANINFGVQHPMPLSSLTKTRFKTRRMLDSMFASPL